MFKGLFRKTSPGAPPEPAGDEAAAKGLVEEGNRLEDAGRLKEAAMAYRQAIAAAPAFVGGHLNLGIVLAAQGDASGAKAAYGAALAIAPEHPFAHYNLARLLHRSDLPLALATVGRALAAKPDFVEAQVLLAALLEDAGDFEAALQPLDAALELQPELVMARVNRMRVLAHLDRDEEAIEEARQVLQRTPGEVAALEALALLLTRQKMTQEALEATRAVIAAEPENLEFQSRELMLLNCLEAMSPADLAARHRKFGIAMERAHPERFSFPARSSRPGRRLRVGYVSSDFHTHPVAFFMLPLLERHDRSRFETYCYSAGWRSDELTKGIQGACDRWIDVQRMSDDEIADRIHADGIDVLVDLIGHSSVPRLAVFSQRPAPVQVSWLGYLQTTGLTRMDYRVTDARSSPAELAGPLHTEQLVALEGGQWGYRPRVQVEPARQPPFVSNGFITFGSFTAAAKLTVQTCGRWSRILAALPDARLVIGDLGAGLRRAAVERTFEQLGTRPERIHFLPRMQLPEYYAAFNEVDIALDAYPYSGGTTTLDTLWMSVPVVTAMGDAPLSRSAASVLLELGLDDWVAPRIEDYEQLVLRRAQDREALIRLRGELRQRLQASPLMDEAGFTARLEAAYDRMWAERGV